MDESKLLNDLLSGNEIAFRNFVSQHHNILLSVARGIVGAAIAEEVVQESWISIIKSLNKFEGRSSLKTWMLQIVSNHAKTRLRKESRQIAVGSAEDVELVGAESQFKVDGHWRSPIREWQVATPEQIIENQQLHRIIDSTISSLPPRQQAVLKLRDFEGYAIEEICKILDLSESNTRVLLHRAHAKVWNAIDRHQRGEEL